METNKKRIKFWGIICLLSFVLAIAGIVSFNMGYGEYGRAKKKLSSITDAFNNSQKVKDFKDLKAKVSKKSIVISYKNVNNKTEKYTYELIEGNEYDYIESTYDNIIATFIAREMVDAVYKKDGTTNSIYDIFDFESFKDSTVKDGVNINNNKISINITDSLVIGLKKKINTKLGYKYFYEDDIKVLLNELKNNKTAKKELDSMKLYLIEDDTSYKAYISYNDNIEIGSLMSLGNLIELVNKNAYNELEFDKQKPIFRSDSSYYSINLHTTFTEEKFFNDGENVCELIIYK